MRNEFLNVPVHEETQLLEIAPSGISCLVLRAYKDTLAARLVFLPLLLRTDIFSYSETFRYATADHFAIFGNIYTDYSETIG